MAYELPKLAYDYNALEPHFDAQTMEIHHSRHHQTYITNLNKALGDAGVTAPANVADVIRDLSKLPANIQTAVRNNGGGHWNHSFFWTILSPKGGGTPVGKLAAAIDAELGGLDKLKEAFTQAALTRFGSGWAWLCVGADKKLFVTSTPNQDNPLMNVADKQGTPVLGLDVWEHAYYLKYQNKRPDYVGAFWNVVDWAKADALYQAAL
jgi:Fe-Mn family superoxide dismutase